MRRINNKSRQATMRGVLMALGFSLFFVGHAKADLFASPEELVKSLSQYDFSADRNKFGFFLSVEEPQQPELAPTIVSPKSIEKAGVLWKSKDRALIFITSRPLTESTPTESGILIAISHLGTGWGISDKVVIHAVGKFAKITFKLTSGGKGYSPLPIVTVTTANGGEGMSYEISQTYQLLDGQITVKGL